MQVRGTPTALQHTHCARYSADAPRDGEPGGSGPDPLCSINTELPRRRLDLGALVLSLRVWRAKRLAFSTLAQQAQEAGVDPSQPEAIGRIVDWLEDSGGLARKHHSGSANVSAAGTVMLPRHRSGSGGGYNTGCHVAVGPNARACWQQLGVWDEPLHQCLAPSAAKRRVAVGVRLDPAGSGDQLAVSMRTLRVPHPAGGAGGGGGDGGTVEVQCIEERPPFGGNVEDWLRSQGTDTTLFYDEVRSRSPLLCSVLTALCCDQGENRASFLSATRKSAAGKSKPTGSSPSSRPGGVKSKGGKAGSGGGSGGSQGAGSSGAEVARPPLRIAPQLRSWIDALFNCAGTEYGAPALHSNKPQFWGQFPQFDPLRRCCAGLPPELWLVAVPVPRPSPARHSIALPLAALQRALTAARPAALPL